MSSLTVAATDEITFLKQLVKRFKKNGEPVKRVQVERSVALIVPQVSYVNNAGCLNNDHWAYKVPYGFHDALDITLVKRSKKIDCIDANGEIEMDTDGKKKTKDWYYCAWTQGCLLSFSYGDFFEAVGDIPCLQVVSAKPVVLNGENGVMDDGEVTYQLFDKRGLGEFFTVSQFEFLQVLIYGKTV